MTPSTDYKTRLKQKIVLTPHVRELVFELIEPKTMDYEAGQFSLIKATHPETEEFLSRAYSISSAPENSGEVRFTIEIVEGGKLSPLIDSWEDGDEVTLQGPFGHFVMKSEPDKDLVFVATGVGIAPLKAMIEDLLQNGDPRRIYLCFGLRNQEGLYYQDHFQKLADEYDNFSFKLSLSQPGPGWTGPTGRVTAHLPEKEFSSNTDFYLCGGKPMIDDVRHILLSKNFPEEQIFFEPFFI